MSKPARGAGNMVRDEREEGEERTGQSRPAPEASRPCKGPCAFLPGPPCCGVWSADAAMETVTGCTLQLPVSTEPASQKVVEAHLRRARGVRFRRLTLRTGG